MKRLLNILFLFLIGFVSHAQNTLSLQAGFLGTKTFVAEYERINRMDNLLDSMSLKKLVGSFQASLNADIDIGQNMFLSTGFRYCKKGLAQVVFTDSTGWPWQTEARQHYVGVTLLLGYRLPLKSDRFGIQAATGLSADFAVGRPNWGALFSGPYYRFFMPFSRFNEVDLGWMTVVGVSYKLGPGDILVKASYTYGLSDVLEDAFTIGRTMSVGLAAGYTIYLTPRKSRR